MQIKEEVVDLYLNETGNESITKQKNNSFEKYLDFYPSFMKTIILLFLCDELFCAHTYIEF